MRPLVLLRATIVCSFAVGVGALYVLVHEYRRKEKRRLREAKAAAAERHSPSKAGPIGRARLIAILEESAAAAYQLIEQTRRLVVQKSQQDGCSLEKAVEELQKDFEKAMEAVVGAIRQNHSVTEQQMTQAMMANQADLEVQAALAALRAAMNGTEPPKVAAEAEAAKLKTSRRTGKSRRKG
jgi:hypothetical protein